MPMERNCAKEAALQLLVQCKGTMDLKESVGWMSCCTFTTVMIQATSTVQAFSGCT